MAEIRSGGVSGLEEVEDCLIGRGCHADGIVRQYKLVKVAAVISRRGANSRIRQARRLGIGIGVEGGLAEAAVPRPEPATADLMRVRFACNPIGDMGRARMLRRAPAGEARDRHVKAAPEEMYRAGFAEKARAELLEKA